MDSPTRLGPFVLNGRLGHSASRVFRATHSQTKKIVALRLIPAATFAHSGAKTEFADELALIKRVQHANVARCFGGGFDQGYCFYAYELCEGETLAARLARRGKLGWEQTLDLIRQVADGLSAIHELGIAYELLTPDRIVLSSKDQAKIVDLRSHPESSLVSQRPSDAEVLRRAHYRSPEQFRGADPVPARADLYALGCIAYECLTGQPPFTGKSVEELQTQHLEVTPPKVSTISFDTPVWVDALVTQLLEKKLTQRPHAAQTVLIQIDEARRRIASGAAVATHAVSGFSSLKVDADKQEVRRLLGGNYREASQQSDRPPIWESPLVIGAGLVIAVAILGFFAYLGLRPKSEEELFARAKKLMAAETAHDYQVAKEECLEPLVKRFPEGKYRVEVEEMLERVSMRETEGNLRLLSKLGREPPTEAGRQYQRAREYEQYGDRATALERYQAIVELFAKSAEDRPFVLLAKRQIAQLEESAQSGSGRAQFLQQKLEEARRMMADGNGLQARTLLLSLIRLYENNAEVAGLVKKAKEMLKGNAPASGSESDEESEAADAESEETRSTR
jgi:hypothetical protein